MDVLDDDMIPGSGLIPLFGLALYMKSELSPEGTIWMKGEYLLSFIPLFFNKGRELVLAMDGFRG